MILNGRIVELLVNVEHKICSKYVVIDKGVKLLYGRLQKSLYVLMCRALLFYLKFVTDFNYNGLILNTYNPCVDNKLVNR